MTTISIIIPTLNRCEQLFKTLGSLAAIADGDRDVEIIIVDNGSSDQTPQVFQAIAERYPRLLLRHYCDDMPGLLTGRHKGAKEAQGDILAYLDDDVLLASSWLEGLRDGFRDPAVVLVGGPSRPQFDCDPPAWLDALWWEFEGGQALGWLSLIDLGNEKKANDPCFVWGLNFSIRKHVLRECGGFHPDCLPKVLQRYQGDGETGLSLNIRKLGNQAALYHPAVAVTHMIPKSRLTLEAFEARGFYQGVCDSYTSIRLNGGVRQARDRSWGEWYRLISGSMQRAISFGRRGSETVSHLIGRAHSMGVAFHQGQVRNDPVLLNWVLKEDYFDYALPAGWQSRVEDDLARSRSY
jgi:glucosyl-dolichyl phosphate glucuronosyltransferase